MSRFVVFNRGVRLRMAKFSGAQRKKIWGERSGPAMCLLVDVNRNATIV